MEGELIRQAEVLFGDAMTKRLLEGTPGSKAHVDGPTHDAALEPVDAAAKTVEIDPPTLMKLEMTARQERRLWRHIQSIENFWEGLREIEPGIVAELARLAGDRRWEIIF